MPDGWVVRDLPTRAIHPSRQNPRTNVEVDLAALAASFGIGIAQLILVQPTDAPDTYEIIAGARRWRAAVHAGMERIPCVVRPPLRPVHALLLRTVEHAHRAELDPLDEAVTLKSCWYALNAEALGVADAAEAALAAAESLWEGLRAMRAVLDAAGFQASRPPVTQEMAITRLALNVSPSVFKKKLQLLAIDDRVVDQVRQLGLSAATIRALVRLDPEAQRMVVAAAATDPVVARKIRTIVQGVQRKGRSLDEALLIAQGTAVPPDLAGPATAPGEAVPGDAQRDGAAAAAAPAPGPTPSAPDAPRGDIATLVGEVVELGMTLYDTMTALRAALRTEGLRGVPPDQRELIQDALAIVADAVQQLG